MNIYIEMDQKSESMRYVASAITRGVKIHEIGKYGESDVEPELYQEMADWLRVRGYNPPGHYWVKNFPK